MRPLSYYQTKYFSFHDLAGESPESNGGHDLALI